MLNGHVWTSSPPLQQSVAVLGNGRTARRRGAFVAGPENDLVSRVWRDIRSSGRTPQPLVITGVGGVGKSLLLALLVEEFQRAFAGQRVLLTTAVDLARGYAHAVETDAVREFRERHGRLDLLAIDDLHRLEEKTAAQQELLHLVDALERRGSRVLATLPVHPLEAVELAYALRSRLAEGLVVPLALPGVDARRQLIEHFASLQPVEITPEAADALAGAAGWRLATPAHILRAVIMLDKLASSSGRIDLATVEEFLAEQTPAKASLKAIAAAASRRLMVSVSELRGKSRLQSVASARGLAMYMARELGGASYAQIGRYFGNRDHSTVMHACKKTAATISAEPHLRQLIDQVASELAAEEVTA